MEIDFREIVITTIGREAQSDETDDTFDFQSKAYKILLQWPHFDKLLGKFGVAGSISFW